MAYEAELVAAAARVAESAGRRLDRGAVAMIDIPLEGGLFLAVPVMFGEIPDLNDPGFIPPASYVKPPRRPEPVPVEVYTPDGMAE